MARRKLGFWRRFAVLLVVPQLRLWTRRTWSGQQHIPKDGPAILVANHLSHFDPLVISVYVYAAGRWPRFLAKASVFRIPLIGPMLRKNLQIPVERGSVEAVKSLDVLVDVLNQGSMVIVYPEGTTTKEPDLWPMRGKTGAARLALATGAPVVPVAHDGSQAIFDPRTGKLRLRPGTPVSVTAGPPIDLSKWLGEEPTRETLDEMTDAIMLGLRDLLATIREGTPPPLFEPPVRHQDAPPAVAE